MGNKDKIMISLAFIALLFIAFVTISNYPGESKRLAMNAYYTSDEQTMLGRREGSSYSLLNNTGRLECPGLDNRTTQDTLIYTTGATTYTNAYGACYLPFTKECVKIDTTSLNKSNYSMYMKYPDIKDDWHLRDVFPDASYNISGNYYEIIAPFSYSFKTSNFDTNELGVEEIVISNSAGNCIIRITNPVNWFCAGVPGTSTKYSNYEEPVSWDKHSTKHLTRVGKGASHYSTGSAGDLICYGDENTKITINADVGGGYFSNISLHKLYLTSSYDGEN